MVGEWFCVVCLGSGVRLFVWGSGNGERVKTGTTSGTENPCSVSSKLKVEDHNKLREVGERRSQVGVNDRCEERREISIVVTGYTTQSRYLTNCDSVSVILQESI